MNMASLQRAENGTVQLSVTLPEPGSVRELRGEVVFPPGSAARSATVSLVLLGNTRGAELIARPTRVDATGTITGCTSKVQREAGAAAFSLPLPPMARTFTGTQIRITVGVVVTPDIGEPLRLVIDPPLCTRGVRPVLRHLPIEQALARPGPFFAGVLLALAGVALVSVAFVTDLDLPGQLGLGALIGGPLLAIFMRRGMSTWFRVGNAGVRLEAHDAGAGSELVVRVRGSSRLAGGRARLVATEYEWSEGAEYEYGEIASAEAALEPHDSGVLSARIPLLPVGEAPPTQHLGGYKRKLAVRWMVKVELANRRGAIGRAAIPVHVSHVAGGGHAADGDPARARRALEPSLTPSAPGE